MLAPMQGQDAALLDDSIEGVLLRFSISAKNDVAPWLWSKEAQTACRPKQGAEVRGQAGVQFVRPMYDVGIFLLVDQLMQCGWRMTGVLAKDWLDKTNQRRYSCQFVFSPQTRLQPIEPALGKIIAEYGVPTLTRLAANRLWQVNAYRNPLGENAFGIAIGCASPTPVQVGKSPAARLQIVGNRLQLN